MARECNIDKMIRQMAALFVNGAGFSAATLDVGQPT